MPGETDPEIRLIYFDIRGMAEPVRWMLKMRGVDFVDERIPLDAWANKRKRSSPFGLIKDRDPEARKKSKDNSATQQRFKQFIGQLPVLYFGDIVLTQTLSVTRYISRRYNFNGETEMEEARADEVADLVYDLRLNAVDYEGKAFKTQTPDIVRHTVFRDLKNAPDSAAKEKMKEDFKTMHFPLFFKKFANLLEQSGGEFIAGKNLTYGDLVLVNFLEVIEDLVDPLCLEEFPTLKGLKERIFAIPEIKEWRTAQKVEAEESGFPESG